MASQTRQKRVQELLVRDVSDIIRREIKDPRLGFITITDAEVSGDLRHAKVFYTVLGDAEARAETGQILNRAAGFIRSQFAQRVNMRFVPDIRFEFDKAVERGIRISQLLAEVKQDEERLAAGTAESSSGTDSSSE